MTDIPPLWREYLIHMTGSWKGIRRGRQGHRNHYCVNILANCPEYQSMLDMEKAGFVKAGRKINNDTMQYFHATLEGCQAIGLSKAAIKRAMEGL